MQKELGRIHRLAMPLIIQRRGTLLHVSDGEYGHDYEFKDFGQIKIVGIDPDGFITFEVSLPEQQTLIESPLHGRFATVGSFTLIDTSSSKTSGAGGKRGTYEYYKRSTDEYYYASHKIGGVEDKKIHLGSLQDSASPIHQIAKACQHFDETTWFDRKGLAGFLAKALTHGQKLKSALDILVHEGYLERRELRSKKGKIHELYRKTPKLQVFR
jgi:hypothetical protein